MWLATKYGFYSVVQKEPPGEGKAALFHVRARVREDLENLLRATALQHEILEWPGADYRYRFLAGPEDVLTIVSHLSASLDYANFKSMIGKSPDQRAKLPAYHDVWHAMAALQK